MVPACASVIDIVENTSENIARYLKYTKDNEEVQCAILGACFTCLFI
jgi:hypothetical protein